MAVRVSVVVHHPTTARMVLVVLLGAASVGAFLFATCPLVGTKAILRVATCSCCQSEGTNNLYDYDYEAGAKPGNPRAFAFSPSGGPVASKPRKKARPPGGGGAVAGGEML